MIQAVSTARKTPSRTVGNGDYCGECVAINVSCFPFIMFTCWSDVKGCFIIIQSGGSVTGLACHFKSSSRKGLWVFGSPVCVKCDGQGEVRRYEERDESIEKVVRRGV